MPTLPAIDLTELLKGIPRGAWVAISAESETVVAYGSDMRAVLEEARSKGESDPLIVRVPESSTALML
jgi:Family of unknown function (DUF5678)